MKQICGHEWWEQKYSEGGSKGLMYLKVKEFGGGKEFWTVSN
jgi:hypothetical protein